MFRVALTFALLTQTTGLLAPLESYEQMMAAHPLETKAFTQAALWSVSDCIAQRRLEQQPLDLARTAKFATTGLGSAVLWSEWFDVVDAVVAPVAAPGARIGLSIALETFGWAPLYFATYLIPVSTLQNGGSWRVVPAELRATLLPLSVANAKVWTLPNLIIYSCPLEWRVLASNAVDLVWGVICSDAAAQCGGASGDDDDELCVVPADGRDAPPLLEMVEAQPPRLRGLRSALPRAWWKPAVRLRRAARSLRP